MDSQSGGTEPNLGGMLDAGMMQALVPLTWRAGRLGSPSAWWQHVPFAHWLIGAARPRCLVELGTHAGVSYTAFCQAVILTGAGTDCYAIDTWQGDSQAGEYGEDVYDDLASFHNERFGSFSTLLRSTFDEALSKFADNSIDLLHIDGLHTYDAARHDYESWKPKLSNRAVVIFHDTNEHAGDFGVWRLWRELQGAHPSFEFLHGHGLGVLAVGTDAPPAVLALCHQSEPAALSAVRALFARVGERWWYETRERMVRAELTRHGSVAAAQLEALRQEMSVQAANLQADVGSLQAALGAAQVREAALERDKQVIAEQTTRAEAALGQALAEIAELRRQLAEAQAAIMSGAERERQLAAERDTVDHALAQAHLALAQAELHKAQSARATGDLEARLAQLQTVHAEQSLRMQQVEAERDHAIHERRVVTSSTLWRAVQPLRTTAHRLPPGTRRAMRGAAKLSWWTATLSLPQRLRARKRVVELSSPTEVFAPAIAAAEPLPTMVAVPPLAVEETARPSADRVRSVVWVSAEPDTPGHQYRVARPLAAAAALGLRVSWMPLDQVGSRIAEIAMADVLVIWRAAWDDNVALAIDTARRNSARVLFDVDDLMVDPAVARLDIIDGIRTQNLTEVQVADHYARVRATMLAADVCVTTTDELAGHMRRPLMPTLVMQNGFDRAGWRASRLAARCRAARQGDGLVRIGYAGGSPTHQRDFGQCAGAVAAVLAAHPQCRLVLFRKQDGQVPLLDIQEFPALAGLQDRIEWRDQVPLSRLPDELARFDINLAPLEVGNPFCEAKSELKLFEAAIAGVPTVASPTGPFRRAVRHGETGFLAGTAAEWEQALARLVEDTGLRSRLASRAALDALWTFGPEKRLQDVERLFDLTQGGRTGTKAFALHAAAEQRGRAALPAVPRHDVVFQSDQLAIADVSVVIPLYNYAATVVEALESARAQTERTLDLVVVDDHSTDDSLQTVLDWVTLHAARFNRVVVARNVANQGLGATRNAGFALADTPWIMTLDADNRLLPACVETCLRTAEQTGASFAYPLIQHFGESSHQMGGAGWDPVRLLSSNYVDAMALISRAAWVGVGGFDPVRTGWEDFDLWCRFAETGLRGERVPGGALAEYRVHGTSMIQSSMKQREKVRWMMDHLEGRHPWLRLLSPIEPDLPETPIASAPPPGPDARLNTLLPLLRCPETGQRLVLTTERDALVTADGARRWPLVAGRPVFFPGMDAPRIVPGDHLSNSLPDSAAALIRETQGMVLHLSAGGSADQYDHVVEAEAAVFRHTDVIADVHVLPFADQSFEAVIALNAFEHYRDPPQAAREILRVLKPGGRVLIRTAFLQPQHEAPWHFYNCTRWGLEAWFQGFATEKLWVSENFHAGYSISWLASECEALIRRYTSDASAERFLDTPLRDVIAFWRSDEATRGVGSPLWEDLSALPQQAQEVVGAGFEYLGRRPQAG